MSPVNTYIFIEKTSFLKRRHNGQGQYQNYNPGPQESSPQLKICLQGKYGSSAEWDTEKAGLLNASFSLVFAGKICV